MSSPCLEPSKNFHLPLNEIHSIYCISQISSFSSNITARLFPLQRLWMRCCFYLENSTPRCLHGLLPYFPWISFQTSPSPGGTPWPHPTKEQSTLYLSIPLPCLIFFPGTHHHLMCCVFTCLFIACLSLECESSDNRGVYPFVHCCLSVSSTALSTL